MERDQLSKRSDGWLRLMGRMKVREHLTYVQSGNEGEAGASLRDANAIKKVLDDRSQRNAKRQKG